MDQTLETYLIRVGLFLFRLIVSFNLDRFNKEVRVGAGDRLLVAVDTVCVLSSPYNPTTDTNLSQRLKFPVHIRI